MLYEEIVEEVARAIWEATGPLGWEKMPELRRAEIRVDAAAAVNKIEELTRYGSGLLVGQTLGELQGIDLAEMSDAEPASLWLSRA